MAIDSEIHDTCRPNSFSVSYVDCGNVQKYG